MVVSWWIVVFFAQCELEEQSRNYFQSIQCVEWSYYVLHYFVSVVNISM